MTEYVSNLDVFVVASSQAEADAIVHRLCEEVLTQEVVREVRAERPEKT